MKRAAMTGAAVIALALAAGSFWAEAGEAKGPYRSPMDVAYSPDGATLAVADHTAACLALVDVAGGKAAREVALNGQPYGVLWSADGSKVYVAERNAGAVAEVDAAAGKVARRLNVGLRPAGMALAPKKNLLLVTNTVTDDVSVVDLAAGKEKGRIAVLREPHFVAVTPDESMAVVTNLLPVGSAADPQTASSVTLVDLDAMKAVASLKLPGGSTACREVAISPDGKWAYTVHTVGRTTLPTTQLERGWVNTNAVTVIDLAGKTIVASLLLDRLSEGAADPWGVVLSKDGKTLWVTLSGVHQVARVDLEGLHLLLEGKDLPPPKDPTRPRAISDIWNEVKKDPKKRELLVNDLAALYGAGLLDRTPIEGKGPRGVDLSPDGKTLASAVYFSGAVALTDADTGKTVKMIAIGASPAPDQLRRGEQIFHDAVYCFQHWLSCASCHPNQARADGLNWDLLNDGLGNPKNGKSLIWSHKTPPTMSLGVRASMEVATVAGFRYIQFHEPQPDEIEAVQAWLRSIEPEPSPHLEKGQLSAAAKRGKAIFEGKANCKGCHPAGLLTDLKTYDVGTRYELDRKDAFDTPTLIELYRTGPYLHSGEAVTLMQVLTDFNKQDKHGTTSKLSKEELADLVAYLESL
jgi:DNA-binding beta-propeller fold protein YncE/cytochrome c1